MKNRTKYGAYIIQELCVKLISDFEKKLVLETEGIRDNLYQIDLESLAKI